MEIKSTLDQVRVERLLSYIHGQQKVWGRGFTLWDMILIERRGCGFDGFGLKRPWWIAVFGRILFSYRWLLYWWVAFTRPRCSVCGQRTHPVKTVLPQCECGGKWRTYCSEECYRAHRDEP